MESNNEALKLIAKARENIVEFIDYHEAFLCDQYLTNAIVDLDQAIDRLVPK